MKMTKTQSLYSTAIPYKKPFDEKKLEKKDLERQVVFGTNTKKKKRGSMFFQASLWRNLSFAPRDQK